MNNEGLPVRVMHVYSILGRGRVKICNNEGLPVRVMHVYSILGRGRVKI